MRSKDDILLEIDYEIKRLNNLHTELKETIAANEQDQYITMNEAVEISGLNERQLIYKVATGEVKEKRLTPRKRLLCKDDVARFAVR